MTFHGEPVQNKRNQIFQITEALVIAFHGGGLLMDAFMGLMLTNDGYGPHSEYDYFWAAWLIRFAAAAACVALVFQRRYALAAVLLSACVPVTRMFLSPEAPMLSDLSSFVCTLILVFAGFRHQAASPKGWSHVPRWASKPVKTPIAGW